jgi:hypothetical protein
MKTSFNLSISNPCTENWDSFTPSAGGNHCSRCNKIVVDFTAMTNEEIIRFFEQQSSPTCGRFTANQLKSYSHSSISRIRPGFTLLKAGILGAVLMLSIPGVVQAQTEKTKTEQVIGKTAKTAPPETEHVVGGVVRSQEDHSPLAGVNVLLKGSTVGTVTDVDGRFEFPQMLGKGDVLQFSFIGLMTEELTIPMPTVNGPLEINMKMSFELLGKVAVNEIYSEPPSRLRSWLMKVKSLF